VGFALVQAIYITGLCWWEGTLPVGQIDLPRLFVVVVAPYLLGTRFYLDRIASAALDDFRPALSVDDAELERMRYELTTLPARTTLVLTALAALVFLANWARVPDWLLEQYTHTIRRGPGTRRP
jgi:hypothetical protein